MEKKVETTIQGLGFRVWGVDCRPMMKQTPPVKGRNIRIPILSPIRGKGSL